MKFLRLLFKNVMRNRRRAFLTVLSVTVSVFLIATLRTVLTELENPPETPESALRLISRHRVSLANILPIAYRDRIAKVEGVEAVTGSMWFGGIYKDPKNFFPQFAVNADQFFRVYADMRIPEEQKAAFVRDRTGALAGENLAARFGWKIGDKIHLEGTIFDMDLELTLRGIYAGGGDDGGSLWYQWDYFNEGLNNAGLTGFYVIRARSAEEVPGIAERVDALFLNSSSPTKTESEKSFVLGFLSMMGNVRLLITSISSVVIFTIVLVAANTMAMAIRERVREIGILKALGFRRRHVLGLLLGESVFLALAGAILGSWGAKLLYSNVKLAAVTGGFIQSFNVTPGTLALCFGLGVFVGIFAAGVPAWQASRRRVLDSLSRVV